LNYYNEYDPFAAAWLRELIKDGLIPDGVVDERSIADVAPEDLKGFTQCHFFCGIGGWSRALHIAGWSPDRPVWTGSPPCQPFSSAGNQKGKDDLRHLWPVFFNLIRECKPPTIFGEQVASAIRFGWLDDLQTDLEAEGYAAAAVVLPSGGIGAPHKQQQGERLNSSWPTPSVRDYKDTGDLDKSRFRKSGKERNDTVPRVAYGIAPWATPNTLDHMALRSDEALLKQATTVRKGRTFPNNLREQVDPRSQEIYASGKTPPPSTAEMENTVPSQLNPRFSLWLMGYPIEWVYCAERVTQSSRKRQRKS
jgi:site-specific DNA-cytosine methylase